MIIKVKVILKSARSQVVGWEEDVLKIRLHAVPEKGQANAELLSFLSKTLDLPKSHIELISGMTSRQKKVSIQGLTHEELIKRLKLK